MKCEAIYRKRAEHKICEMCKARGLSRSTYYRWIRRIDERKNKVDGRQAITAQVRAVFEENKRVSGYRKMQKALELKEINLSVYKIRKIMRESGMYPELVIKFKPYSKKKSDGRYGENILEQKFDVKAPNEVWTGEITYIKTKLVWVYLAVVIDLFNREVIGYSVSKAIDTELVKQALGNALIKKEENDSIMFHSNRSCQYSSNAYSKILSENGIIGSMSRVGCPYDNSCVEGFFALIKKECIYKREYNSISEIEADLFDYIEMFYNRKRLHSKLGYLSPMRYRMQYDALKAS